MNIRNCIIVCDSAEHTGGVSTVMLAQAQGLFEAGINVFVFAAFGPVDEALHKWVRAVHCMRPHQGERSHLAEVWNFAAVTSLAQYLEPFDAENSIVHIHSISMGLSPSIAVALRKKKIRYIVTAHDASWACPTGYSYNMRTKQYCTLEPMSSACVSTLCDKRSYLHKGYKVAKMWVLDEYSDIKRNAAAIITPSELLTRRLRTRVPSTTPVITLLNPISTAKHGFRRSHGEYFLFVGRLWEEKGIQELLQALENRYPLVIIGDGPLRAPLAARYPQTIFKGWLAPEDVLHEMQGAIALILPSIYLEAFGLVVAEALSQGVPAIVSNRAGASSLIRHAENGFVVDMSAPEQLQRACDLLMDPETALSMSRVAYTSYWRNPLTTQAYTEGLMRIFEAIEQQ